MEKTKLLIVDDEPSIIRSLNRTLNEEGLDILTAENGFEALSLIETNHIDLIISDQRMPQMTGVEFLQVVNQKYPNIITMMLTAYADINVAIQAINEIGVYKFILKPWEDYNLKMTIDKAKRLSRLMTTDTILTQDLFESSDQTHFASKRLKNTPEKKQFDQWADSFVTQAAANGLTDMASVDKVRQIGHFDRKEFDTIELTSDDIEEIFSGLDQDMRKEIRSTALDVCYSRHTCKKIGVNYSNIIGEEVTKVYKYALYYHHLI